MNDLDLIQAVEKYISGGMTPDERVYFEQLRKSNPEVDQLVVEHTFFMQQLNRYDQTKRMKSQLDDIHIDLAEKGFISSTRLKGSARVAYLYKRYKRVAAIAASIAGITAIAISVLISSVAPHRQSQDLESLSRKIKTLEKNDRILDTKIENVDSKLESGSTATPDGDQPKVTYKTGGTGFMIDARGYLVTNAHVVDNSKIVAIQDVEGKDYSVEVVYKDLRRDLAILKITDGDFKSPANLPYSIRRKSADIAEPVYTLGYPRNEIVYGEGYLAAKTGYNGDTLTCQIAIAANPGNSGGPIINRNGEIIGVLSARQTSAIGAVFATQSKYIYQIIADLQKAEGDAPAIRLPSTSNLKSADRTEQVNKIRKFVYMVKVS